MDINDIDVDCITNEIVALVLATINEQSQKIILLNNEHDLTLFKPVERKHKCINVVHDAKQINTLELANTYFPLLYFLNNVQLNIQSHKGGLRKIHINCVIF
jgi:hypothetical protein